MTRRRGRLVLSDPGRPLSQRAGPKPPATERTGETLTATAEAGRI